MVAATTVHRIEVRPQPGRPDHRGAAARRDAAGVGMPSVPSRIDAVGVYLIQGTLEAEELRRIAQELLADPVTEAATIGTAPPTGDVLVEVHPLPGVMDPVAESIESAVRSLLGRDVAVRTGQRYDMHAVDEVAARALVERCLANELIHVIHTQPYHPASFPMGAAATAGIIEVPLRELSDDALRAMSRQAHLFLSLDEMRAIQAHYRRLGREPRDIELETIAQTWSEHCVHKTLKATIQYREQITDVRGPGIATPGLQRPGHVLNADGSVTIDNLLKSTIAAATQRLIDEGVDWCLSVFVDNAGVIAFDDQHAVCFKVETHNHPSALEPYGGAATGIGGCIRDIIGTGLAARPIAATDVFCVAFPDHFTTEHTEATETASERSGARGQRSDNDGLQSSIVNRQSSSPLQSSSASSVCSVLNSLPAGVLHPRRILTQVVRGVRDYGNRMGIPTLNGAVWFHDGYVGNPLVFCGCVGVMPCDKISGQAHRGDRIIALGGRTGRDGIHGATFSSAELTDAHADEFSHAVQIGNAITEKKMLDVILLARDHADGCLYHGITDCGAGGFSSAVGEMGRELGARVTLERAPLKYAGLTPTEIWISEAQERMVLAVPPRRVPALAALCEAHEVEWCDLGQFGTAGRELLLTHAGTEVGRLSMDFLHDGLPRTTREATWNPASRLPARSTGATRPGSLQDALLQLLAHPNVASKHWIIRQYDHEVQGGTVIKPLVGARGDGPSDAAVITPVPNATRGLAIACGLATGWSDDPYLMALAAIDECVRNLVCVGADPDRIAILDNFCWPSCDDPRQLGGLVRAAEGCYDAALAYRTPFISGKDSLNNQFTTEDGRTIRIPPTLLISGMGIVADVRRCVTMDAKQVGNLLVLVGAVDSSLASSHYALMFGCDDEAPPRVDLDLGPRAARAVAKAIAAGLARSAHDVSDGGLLVAAAEMCFAGQRGLEIDLDLDDAIAFNEGPSRYLLEVHPENLLELKRLLAGVPHTAMGRFIVDARLKTVDGSLNVPVDDLRAAWRGTLDWQ